MATPSHSTDVALQPSAGVSPSCPPSPTAGDVDAENMGDIPRRLMRVKVLYTFDDENISNCLARLPDALSIPTVSLDETTQIGVIELKTCIQAVVGASPELVAKLGHDYTVYAYDYSEYETPLVGQGMLSWVLASASTTPNAPAEQSQTMVTGRVCKNILALFSNGIKETLEVKLRLVPVPTCMQSEYVENLERYHNLSKIVPQGLPADYNEWADFLNANPAIRQLAQPAAARDRDRQQSAGVESVHEMLSRQAYPEDGMRFDSFQDNRMSFGAYGTRASSPAVSMASFHHLRQHPPRPTSQASFHSESATHSQHHGPAGILDQEELEEGPPKKRARIIKAKRPKKTSALGVKYDSLRVTASTAASVRTHRPHTAHAGAAVSVEQVPRAPTPRPGNTSMPFGRGSLRPSAPSLLRHASIDGGRPLASPCDPGIYSDYAMESADEGRGRSPTATPAHMPSSPPLMPRRTVSPTRSSPELPSLPPTTDSGFVSDLPVGRDEEDQSIRGKPWDGSDLPTANEPMQQRRCDNANPGLVERLPYLSDALYVPRTTAEADFMNSFQEKLMSAIGTLTPAEQRARQQTGSSLPPSEMIRSHQQPQPKTLGPFPPSQMNADLPKTIHAYSVSSGSFPVASGDPVKPLSANFHQNPRARGLPRSHTWSGGEPMSDGAFTDDGNTRPRRSREKVKRQDHIRGKLKEAIKKGEMPTYCNNCGQIDTPTWRRAFMRIEGGSPNNIQVTSVGTGITAYEVIEPEEDDDDTGPRYRIFKQSLTESEWEVFKEDSVNKGNSNPEAFKALTLCNPCGLWLNKKNAMRPHRVWAKSNKPTGDKPKRKRYVRKLKADTTMSDAVVPESEANMPGARDESEAPPSLDGIVDEDSQLSATQRSLNARFMLDSQLDHEAAQAALRRAIQSSPVGLSGTQDSPINLETSLTPNPTRRLLFPSPRQLGEKKHLADSHPSQSKTSEANPHIPELNIEDTNKENFPPAAREDDEDLAHLFDDPVSPKSTPTNGRTIEDLLKTPTPSCRRIPLTPKRDISNAEFTTPTRVSRTPRANGRAATVAPETPFTRQLNALLSDCVPGSPSQVIDFSSFPSFNTPGRHGNGTDFLSGGFSSDFPMPSSPPTALTFSVFEDPNTSTVGLWSGASIFDGSDAIMSEAPNAEIDQQRLHMDLNMLKMHGISADFETLIAQVAADSNNGVNGQTMSLDTLMSLSHDTIPPHPDLPTPGDMPSPNLEVVRPQPKISSTLKPKNASTAHLGYVAEKVSKPVAKPVQDPDDQAQDQKRPESSEHPEGPELSAQARTASSDTVVALKADATEPVPVA